MVVASESLQDAFFRLQGAVFRRILNGSLIWDFRGLRGFGFGRLVPLHVFRNARRLAQLHRFAMGLNSAQSPVCVKRSYSVLLPQHSF